LTPLDVGQSSEWTSGTLSLVIRIPDLFGKKKKRKAKMWKLLLKVSCRWRSGSLFFLFFYLKFIDPHVGIEWRKNKSEGSVRVDGETKNFCGSFYLFLSAMNRPSGNIDSMPLSFFLLWLSFYTEHMQRPAENV
jgi:hypothetical protein